MKTSFYNAKSDLILLYRCLVRLARLCRALRSSRSLRSPLQSADAQKATWLADAYKVHLPYPRGRFPALKGEASCDLPSRSLPLLRLAERFHRLPVDLSVFFRIGEQPTELLIGVPRRVVVSTTAHRVILAGVMSTNTTRNLKSRHSYRVPRHTDLCCCRLEALVVELLVARDRRQRVGGDAVLRFALFAGGYGTEGRVPRVVRTRVALVRFGTYAESVGAESVGTVTTLSAMTYLPRARPSCARPRRARSRTLPRWSSSMSSLVLLRCSTARRRRGGG